jgi:hypothetical protein
VTRVSCHSGHVLLHDALIPSDSRPQVMVINLSVFFNTELVRFTYHATLLYGRTRKQKGCRVMTSRGPKLYKGKVVPVLN